MISPDKSQQDLIELAATWCEAEARTWATKKPPTLQRLWENRTKMLREGYQPQVVYSPSATESKGPSEEACRAAYWRRGKESKMGDEELAELWPEDREHVMAEMRAEFAILNAAPQVPAKATSGDMGGGNAEVDGAVQGREKGRSPSNGRDAQAAASKLVCDEPRNPSVAYDLAAAAPVTTPPEETSSCWIACKDRMPPTEGAACVKYLCWFQDDYAVLDFDNQCGWLWGDGSYMHYQDGVTHWQELPSGPKQTSRMVG